MKKSLFLLFFIFATSCANNAVHVKMSKSSVNTFSAQSDDYVWHNFWFVGWFQDKGVDAEKVCRNRGGVAATVTEQRWFQALMGMATFGIYSPRITYIYCVNGVDNSQNVLEAMQK